MIIFTSVYPVERSFVLLSASETSVSSLLCKINEKLSSTEDGKRLEELREKLECLRLVLENEADEKKSE